jgi:hypothetical protein
MKPNVSPRYIDTAEAAKMLRAELKRHLPGVKFSVKISRYAGGSSTDIKWTDGPTEDAVRKIAARYDGRGFDGMIDLAYSYYHWLLPDGTVEHAGTDGTEASRGSVPAWWNPAPHPAAELIHFVGGYNNTSRSLSEGFLRTIAEEVAAKYGHPKPLIGRSSYTWKGKTEYGSPGILDDAPVRNAGGEYLGTLVYRESRTRDARDEAVLEEVAATFNAGG